MDGPARNHVFLFEAFRLDRPGGGLFRRDAAGGWVLVDIGARALDVLAVFVASPGQLLSKNLLLETVWPGQAVEEKNLTVQISTLRRVLDEARAGGSCIQTAARQGYRFVAPVTRPEDAQSSPIPLELNSPSVRILQKLGVQPRAVVAMFLAALLAIGCSTVWWLSRAAPALNQAPRLSLVVLPFQNLGKEDGDDHLAQAVTDDLTTDLSHMPGSFVIARQSAYTYQAKPIDVRQIGRDLGVRYVVEGSVRLLGETLRVNAQLVATDTGAHLWADRFDQPLADLGAGQDAIVRRIGQTLNIALVDIEGARSRQERPANPDAFDLILRARSIGLHPMGYREHAERLALYEQALRLEPASIVALTQVAEEMIRLAYHETGEDLARAADLITQAAAINPNHLLVLEATGSLLLEQERYEAAIAAYRRLLDEYPNESSAYNQIGICLTSVGRAEEAIPMVEMAMRLNPRSPYAWNRYESMGFALLLLGRDRESITWSQRALAAAPIDYLHARAQQNLRIAAASARLGAFEDAHRALAEANRVWPYDTVRAHWPDDPSSHLAHAQVAQFQAALRLAGERDHAEEDADFGAAADDVLHADVVGLTPTTAPGAETIRTAALQRLLAEQKPIVIDPLLYSWGRSLPGAIGLKHAGSGASYADAMQDRLRLKMQALTKGALSAPIVAIGFNSERFDGRNLALRLVALGYTNVYWYRGGREAWEVGNLPETPVDVQEW